MVATTTIQSKLATKPNPREDDEVTAAIKYAFGELSEAFDTP